MSGRRIDLNSDLGESFGAYSIGPDDQLFPVITSANIACGFHGGDPRAIEAAVQEASRRGVGIGAHPGFPDLVGFGRREMAASAVEVRGDVLYQLGAISAFCRVHGVPLQHVKAHGALYNLASRDREIGDAICDAIAEYDSSLLVYAMPGSGLEQAALDRGLSVFREGFGDRGYNPDGTLVSRRSPGALITDPELAARRMVRLVTEGKLKAIDGSDISLHIDTICIHSDTPGAPEIAAAIRQGLARAGATVSAPGHR